MLLFVRLLFFLFAGSINVFFFWGLFLGGGGGWGEGLCRIEGVIAFILVLDGRDEEIFL